MSGERVSFTEEFLKKCVRRRGEEKREREKGGDNRPKLNLGGDGAITWQRRPSVSLSMQRRLLRGGRREMFDNVWFCSTGAAPHTEAFFSDSADGGDTVGAVTLPPTAHTQYNNSERGLLLLIFISFLSVSKKRSPYYLLSLLFRQQ